MKFLESNFNSNPKDIAQIINIYNRCTKTLFLFQMDWYWNIFVVFIFPATIRGLEEFRPCIEISRELRFPCTCALGPIEQALDGNPSITVNCDKVVFSSEVPAIPYGAPIVTFSQRWAGYQSLPTQVYYPKYLFIIVI